MLFLDFIELLELCATTTSRKYVVKHLRELMHTHCVQPAASTAAAAQSIMRVVALLLPRLVFKAQLSIKTETLQAALQHIQACSTTTPLSLG
jgi:DNA ligase N terminus.